MLIHPTKVGPGPHIYIYIYNISMYILYKELLSCSAQLLHSKIGPVFLYDRSTNSDLSTPYNSTVFYFFLFSLYFSYFVRRMNPPKFARGRTWFPLFVCIYPLGINEN
jgi:hypothetical protein